MFDMLRSITCVPRLYEVDIDQLLYLEPEYVINFNPRYWTYQWYSLPHNYINKRYIYLNEIQEFLRCLFNIIVSNIKQFILEQSK